MTPPDPFPPQVIAMHGWAGDSVAWAPWRQAVAPLGWRWVCGERGYGGLLPEEPHWEPQGRRFVVVHSLGTHLLPPAVLAEADAVVLLASFGRFVPLGREGRRLRSALAGMEAQLVDPSPTEAAADEAEAAAARRAQVMLQSFLAEAAAPDPVELLPPGPGDRPVGPPGRARLRRDLQRLAATEGLPPGFPAGVPVLIVEAAADRIVVPEARAALREALPQAEVVPFEGAGHSLLRAPVVPLVLDWVQRIDAR